MNSMRHLDSTSIMRCLCNTRQIVFEVTERCNLKCHYCGYGSLYSVTDNRTNDDLSYEKVIAFLDYMKSLWKSEYNDSANRIICISFYGGEPLLNMALVQRIITYIEANLKDVGRIFCYSMTTNAILLNKYADYLVEKNFQLLFSLDGDEYGSSYRVFPSGKPAYHSIVDCINEFRNKYPEFYEKNVKFNAVLHNRNAIKKIYDFFSANFDKIPKISELNTMGIRVEKEDEFLGMFQNVTEAFFESENYTEMERKMQFDSPTYKTASLYLLYYSDFKYDNYNELLYGHGVISKLPTGTCLPFSKKVFITVAGEILPCERITHQYTLGWIKEQEVKLDFEEIANKYNSFYARLEPICSKCYGKKGCTQCMFFLHNLDSTSNPIECNGYMNEQEFHLYKDAQLKFFARNPTYYADIMKNLKFR